jgi:hypothetical protein
MFKAKRLVFYDKSPQNLQFVKAAKGEVPFKPEQLNLEAVSTYALISLYMTRIFSGSAKIQLFIVDTN